MPIHLPEMLKCPVCGSRPDIGKCEPWDAKEYGPAPWYACCYRGGENEHCVAANGDTQRAVMDEWNAEVARAVLGQ